MVSDQLNLKASSRCKGVTSIIITDTPEDKHKHLQHPCVLQDHLLQYTGCKIEQRRGRRQLDVDSRTTWCYVEAIEDAAAEFSSFMASPPYVRT